MEVPSMNQDATPSPEAESANAPVLTQPYHAFSSLHNERTGAPKRMANGEFKGPSLPTSPVDASQYGHSRNSSRTSRGSQISDVGETSGRMKGHKVLTVIDSFLVNYARVSRMLWSKFRMVGSRTISTNLNL